MKWPEEKYNASWWYVVAFREVYEPGKLRTSQILSFTSSAICIAMLRILPIDLINLLSKHTYISYLVYEMKKLYFMFELVLGNKTNNEGERKLNSNRIEARREHEVINHEYLWAYCKIYWPCTRLRVYLSYP